MIILAATPIGNLGDASRRLVEVLENAEVVVAEDTRTTQRLLKALEIDNRPRLIALHDHNEKQKAAELAALAAETDIVVMSDAGMPTVSDPGYGLVAEAVAQGVTVTAIPGPSAVLMALAISGLPTDRFTFEGFLPRKPGERARMLAGLVDERRTMVFFEAPHRIDATLTAMAEAFGVDRTAAVCRELTKTYEEVKRGGLADLAAWAADGVRGEITIVVAGAAPVVSDVGSQVDGIRDRVAAGERLKDVCADVAAATGLSKKALYDAALAAR